MEGVVGIILTARRLLGTGELRYVGEHVLAELRFAFSKVTPDPA
jgi:hypothetical protein